MQYDDIEMVPSSTGDDTTGDDLTDTTCNEATTRDTKYLLSSNSAATEGVGGLDNDACVPDTDGIHQLQPHASTSINVSTLERKLWQILMRIEGLNVGNILSLIILNI